jgi:hypothetical protein
LTIQLDHPKDRRHPKRALDLLFDESSDIFYRRNVRCDCLLRVMALELARPLGDPASALRQSLLPLITSRRSAEASISNDRLAWTVGRMMRRP